MSLTAINVLEMLCMVPWILPLTLLFLYLNWLLFFNPAALFSNISFITLVLSLSIIIITLCTFMLSLTNLGNQGSVCYTVAFRWGFIQFLVQWDDPHTPNEDAPQDKTLVDEEPAVQYNWSGWNIPGELQPVQQLELGEVNMEEQTAIIQSLRLGGRTTDSLMPVHQEQDAPFTFNPITQQWEANGPVDKWTIDVGLDVQPPNPIPPPYHVTSVLEPHHTHSGWHVITNVLNLPVNDYPESDP